jgi:hypothetical protein
LAAYSLQKGGIATALWLWNHYRPTSFSFAYFIAFPCMHITQPLIVMWYLKKWRRVWIALMMYTFLLVVAIIGLEWHYVADIIGGVVVAIAAILVIDSPIGSHPPRHSLALNRP